MYLRHFRRTNLFINFESGHWCCESELDSISFDVREKFKGLHCVVVNCHQNPIVVLDQAICCLTYTLRWWIIIPDLSPHSQVTISSACKDFSGSWDFTILLLLWFCKMVEIAWLRNLLSILWITAISVACYVSITLSSSLKWHLRDVFNLILISLRLFPPDISREFGCQSYQSESYKNDYSRLVITFDDRFFCLQIKFLADVSFC